MDALLSLATVGVGALLVLVGLLLIAPEVRVHQIRIYSPGSRLFRVGMLLVTIGIALTLSGDHPKEVLQVAQLIGVAGVLGGVITAGHEWRQARDNHDIEWNWRRSLMLQMVALGGLVLVTASVAM